jgi:hypothetical protein
MKSLISRALIAGAVALSAGAASAQSVSVQYLVQRKPLITGLTAAGQLDFQFYSDADCNSAAGNVLVSASDPGISFERVKRQRIKGLRGSDFLRIDAVLAKAPSAPYVRVVGPGVVPAKAICQPQGGSSSLDITNLVDTTVLEQILAISGFDTIEELTAALEGGEVPTDVVCQILTTAIEGSGISLPVDTCAVGEDGPADLLQQLLGGLGGVGM